MSVIIAGSSGLVGTALAADLRDQGKRVVRLVRRPVKSADEVSWNPDSGQLDPDILRNASAIVSLGGASVGHLPWTSKYRDTLWRSRIDATRTIVTAIRALAQNGEPIPSLISASATGLYGSKPGFEFTERSPVGDTFLAQLCAAWESEALRADETTGVTLLRTAPILHPQGVLRPMIQLTRLGLGGPLGSGKQVWPWISLEDEIRAINHILAHTITGPVNLAGPVHATNAEIGRALARKLHRPFLLPTPTAALRIGLGKDATESLLTTDARVSPEVLMNSGFQFIHPTAEDAIHEIVF